MKKEAIKIIVKMAEAQNLTASKVVATAKPANNPLHPHFEWCDKKAAEEYRLKQARSLIRVVNVYIENDEDKIVRVPNVKRNQEGEYKTASSVVRVISEFERAMSEALQKMKGAEDAVEILKNVAVKESPDKAAFLAIALEGLKTVQEVLGKV